MDKAQLHAILSTGYQPAFWRQVLTEVFGVRTLQQNPTDVTNRLSGGDGSLAGRAIELGTFETSDNRVVGLYQVDLKQDVRIGQNRVGVRSLLRNIYKYDVDAALVVFVQGDKWRLSLISEIRVLDAEGSFVEQKTEPKRFTYLLGEGEAVRTARDRLFSMAGTQFDLNTLIDKFSVEKLTKDFFKRYKELFGEFCEHLTASKQYRQIFLGSTKQPEKGWKDPLAKPIRDFTKILLGRLVFLQFLQKKGWMGVPADETAWENGDARFLKNLFERTKDKDHFHSGALRKLFFETLNRKRTDDLVDSTLGDDIRVPYLNGGLFDTDISTGNAVDFPKQLFAELLDFFEQYNFTIDEDDPYDREVGIDPEMLGHIFENLLEENREKGAFYTPKEIVHYMCQESLIEYLATHLPEGDRPAIETLVRDNQVAKDVTSVAKASEINRLLRDVKICDPAIGSGAFPMGLLKEIFECRRLIYPYLKTNKDFRPAILKKEIIQNNIYGVDIDNGAVEIARLRFWLALVVDEIEPAPLPNLDYKIMQGNSLLERFEDIDLSNLVSADDDNGMIVSEISQPTLAQEWEAPVQVTIFDKVDKEQLHELITKYFDTDEWEERHHEALDKTSLKRQINDIVEGKIHAHILQSKRGLQHKITEYERKYGIKSESDLSRLNKTTRDFKAYQKEKGQFAKFDETEEKLISLQQTESKPYFLWHLWFKDVFDRKGFDIFVGNPPYIQLQRLASETLEYEKVGFQTFAKTGDIYCLFYELGIELLKPGGTLCYITSNSWMKTQYGEGLRTYLAEKANPLKLLNFEDTKIFQTATVETNIILVAKSAFKQDLLAVAVREDYRLNTPIKDYFLLNSIQLTDLDADGWIILSKEDFAIKMHIENVAKPLREFDVRINFGIKTGFNKAFIIPRQVRDDLVAQDNNSEEIIKPILRGRDLDKYSIDFDGQWLINTHNGLREKGIPPIDVQTDFPAIYRYLAQYEEELKARSDKGVHWTNLRNCAYLEDFEKEKILWGELSDKPKFVYENGTYFAEATLFLLTGSKLKFLLTILNSNVALWYFNTITTTSGMGTSRWKKYQIEKLPIPDIDEIDRFEILAEYLTFLFDKGKPPANSFADNRSIAGVFEEVLNMMVYELYFEDHLKENEIEVLQFVNTRETFKDIRRLESDEEKAKVIGAAYSWLQKSENPVRNRTALANIKSPDIIRRINGVTR
jgi:hypothetical protein